MAKRILVVDDTKTCADAYSDVLSDAGEVTTVYDPATAIAAIKQTPFDAVVTD